MKSDKIESMHSNENLIWIDLEMTGLDPATDRIIELAVVVTDRNLSIIADGPAIAVHQSDEVLNGMDEWNQTHHGESGLIDRVSASTYNEAQAEAEIIDFLKQYIDRNYSPMCGNSICQDRRFLANYMQELEAFFHYRNLDVTTVKILCNAWNRDLSSQHTKHAAHTALSDVYDSINELRFFKERFFITS
jgi:oligoribonuclease